MSIMGINFINNNEPDDDDSYDLSGWAYYDDE